MNIESKTPNTTSISAHSFAPGPLLQEALTCNFCIQVIQLKKDVALRSPCSPRSIAVLQLMSYLAAEAPASAFLKTYSRADFLVAKLPLAHKGAVRKISHAQSNPHVFRQILIV